MRCHQADEIDLPGFMAEPDAPQFAEFRNHYPRCAACAAEVRAMAQLEFDLHEPGKEPEPRHPDPASLARYISSAGSFRTADRMAIGRHLDGCAECRAEVTALRSYAPKAPKTPAPEAAAPPAASNAATAPVASARVTSRRAPLRFDSVARLVGKGLGKIGPGALVAAGLTMVAFSVAGYVVAIRAIASDAPPPVSAAPPVAALVGPLALSAEREIRVGTPAAAAGFVVAAPITALGLDEAEMRIRDVARRRELRAWRSVQSPVLGARSIELTVPPSWLEPGRYEVEVHTAGAGDPTAFAFIVEPPAPSSVGATAKASLP